MRSDGNLDGVRLFQKIVDETEAININDSLQKPESRKMTPEEAVLLIRELGLSTNGYEVLRQMAKDCGHRLFPSFKKVSFKYKYIHKMSV